MEIARKDSEGGTILPCFLYSIPKITNGFSSSGRVGSKVIVIKKFGWGILPS